MTDLIRELRAKRRKTPTSSKVNTPAYHERMRDNAARARQVRIDNRLKDQLREYEDSTNNTVCFLCSDRILADDQTVETALGHIHLSCHEESQ